jgi:hypothetical protein
MKPLLAGFFMICMALWAKDSCLECHSNLEGNLQAPAKVFGTDIHSKHGFRCNDCHGGDPNSDDLEISMSASRGFVGKPPRTTIPKLCARCHSDATVIHKFRPQQRIDQLAQYQTSVHGKRLASGDEAVATCIDCHSVHDIRETKDPQSPTYPLRLPATCARCHASAEHMAKYKISTTQFADYKTACTGRLCRRGTISRLRIARPATATTEPLRHKSLRSPRFAEPVTWYLQSSFRKVHTRLPLRTWAPAWCVIRTMAFSVRRIRCWRVRRRFVPSATTRTARVAKRRWRCRRSLPNWTNQSNARTEFSNAAVATVWKCPKPCYGRLTRKTTS